MKGEIWIYLDTESSKKRPGVIIGCGATIADIDVTIAKVTSQQPRNEFDVPIEHWQEAGLIKPSVVRCTKLKTLSSWNFYIRSEHFMKTI
ncbi:type II toxin-antitoxin system PemK/MazF family toxin [Geobacillus thermocatenulatus]|uniref:type II toxin-antitoxin system PemK/MazF family toxin n=1 Tax=Geobacillus thermocatenulatus TaxID=33938 RepID=UPI001FCA01F7|nr:type II toxin-antitoxin system PemK/MazF family toxin [Geobacillus thermocatenulatus]